MFLIHSGTSAMRGMHVHHGKGCDSHTCTPLYLVEAQHLAVYSKLFLLISIQEDEFILHFFKFTLQLKSSIKLFRQLTVICGVRTLWTLESHPHSPGSSTFPLFFRPHPKTMKVSICQLPGNFSEVWTFPLMLVLKPHLWACPGNKALIVCLSCSSPRKEHVSLGLSGHNPLMAVTEEGPLYSETFY